MRFIKLPIIATLATLTMATSGEFTIVEGERDQHPIVEKSTYFPINGWGVTDWFIGLVIGTYSNLQDRWRNGDCRAKWYKLGANLVGYADYFNSPFDVNDASTWVSLVLGTAVTGINIWKLV